MYVNNDKISSRQTLRLYVFDLMGIATLLLPPYLARLCGANGIYAIAFGTGGALLYLYYLGWIMKQMKKDCLSFLKEEVSGGFRKVILVVVALHSIITAGFCAYVFANLMKYSLVQDTSYALILILIVVVAIYAVSGGIEGRARIYEVLFWFILIPYFVMMLASLKDLEWNHVAPVLEWREINLMNGTYLVFLFFMPLFFVIFLIGEKEKNYGRNIVKTVMVSVLFSAFILLASYVLLIGNFGANSLMSLRFPVITLMSTIQFEGNFLKRMDALMLAVWFFTLYALLNLHLHYGVRLLTEIASDSNKKRKWWQLVVPAGVVFVVAYAMHGNRSWLSAFLWYYSHLAVPFMIVAPVFLLLVGRKENEKEM